MPALCANQPACFLYSNQRDQRPPLIAHCSLSTESSCIQCLHQIFWSAVGLVARLTAADIYRAGLATSCDIYQYISLTGVEKAFP